MGIINCSRFCNSGLDEKTCPPVIRRVVAEYRQEERPSTVRHRGVCYVGEGGREILVEDQLLARRVRGTPGPRTIIGTAMSSS